MNQDGIRDARQLGVPKMLVLGLQHMFAMFGATVLVPAITGLSVSATLLFAGLGTLLFHLITGRKVPAFLGSSFAFLGAYGLVTSAGADIPLTYSSFGVACAGLLYLVLALLFKVFGAQKVMRFFPPIVTGPVIIAIGLTLSQSAIANCSANWLVAVVAIAVVIGLVFANIIDPGQGLDIAKEGLKANSKQAPPLIQVFLDIVPLNPIDGLTKGNMLQVIFFALIFGFGLSAIGEKGKPVINFFDVCGEVMIKVTNIVMYYAPIGVFGLIAVTTAKHGLNILMPLIKVIGVMYLAAVVHACVTYLPLVKGSGVSLGFFFKMLASPLLIAFTTCSSAAALSTNLIQVQKLGASKPVASFSIPLGNTINMDGTAVYLGVVAIFVAQIYGIDMPIDKQIQVLAMGVLASIGSVGVPGAGLIMSTIVFTQVGIPLEGIAIIAGIDRVMDMARTTLNVLGDATGAIVVSKWEGDLDFERGAQFAREVEAE